MQSVNVGSLMLFNMLGCVNTLSLLMVNTAVRTQFDGLFVIRRLLALQIRQISMLIAN